MKSVIKQKLKPAIRLLLTSCFIFVACLSMAQNKKNIFVEEFLRSSYSKMKNPEISYETFANINRHAAEAKIKSSNLAAGIAARVNDCGVINLACGNGDFESGSIDPAQWKGGFGSAFTIPTNPLTLAEGFVSGPINSGSAHQTIVTTGTDPNTGIPTVSPAGGSYAVRLGNSVNGNGTEYIAKTIQVTAGQTVLPFRYALVLQDPGHAPSDQPAFSVRAFDCNNVELPNVCDLGNGSNFAVSNAANPFFQSTGSGVSLIAYKDWSLAQVDLSAYIGQTVTVIFMVQDCALGGHYGYAYLDGLCSICTAGCQYNLSLNTTTTSTCSAGNICFDYSLPTSNGSTGVVTIDLDIYQNGIKVGSTISSPSLSSGTSYCFSIDPSTLGLNTASGGFDYVAKGKFTLNGFALSPLIVGQPPTGQNSTQNDDYMIACPCAVTAACKNATVTLVNGQAIMTGADVDNGSSAGTCGIQSLAVSPNTFNCSNIGSNNPVTLTVTGNNGATATCNANVTVLGQIPSCTVTAIPTNAVYTGGVPTNLYIGYGPQNVTLNTVPSGGTSYTYSWSPAAGLSNASVKSPLFTPTAAGNYTFTVTVTNNNGCTSTCSITIRVTDVRCGNKNDKVLVCHKETTASSGAICIAPSAVATHLTGHGDYLGNCATRANRLQLSTSNTGVKKSISIYPNPANNNITISGLEPGKTAEIRIRNIYGDVLLKRKVTTTTLQVDISKLTAGVYSTDIISESGTVSERIVKK